MYCQKCGKEIMDEAVVCPNCGCATSKFTAPAVNQPAPKQHSAEYNKVLDFHRKVKTSYVLAILSLALCMGMGVFIAIVNSFFLRGLNNTPAFTLTDPEELLFYEQAKQKLSTTNRIHTIAAGIGGGLLGVLIVMLLASAQM